MQSISAIRPFDDHLEIYHLPASRIIGVEARSGGKLGNTAPALWDSVFKGGKDSPCLSLELLSAIVTLFSWLIKGERYQSASHNSRWSSRIKPVLEYIEAHYGEELSLDILAGVAGMNARYFCKVFYSLTHTTPMNYVNLYRIEQATFLLDSTDLPITRIATECGFWESSYFTKVFKKYKGTTPKRHRNTARAEC